MTANDSQNGGVAGLCVEHLSLPPMESEARSRPFHSVIIQKSPPVRLEKKINGRYQQWRTCPGDITLLPAGPLVAGRWDVEVDLVCVQVYPSFLERVAGERRGCTWDFPEVIGQPDARIHHLVLALQEGASPDLLLLESMGMALVNCLLFQYSDFGGKNIARSAVLPQSVLRRVRDYVQGNLSTALTLSDMASIAGYSTSHFCVLWKTATGQTPHQHVIEQRLDRARVLLCGGRHTIAQVAVQVGFADHAHLTRHFKRRWGVPPGAFPQRTPHS